MSILFTIKTNRTIRSSAAHICKFRLDSSLRLMLPTQGLAGIFHRVQNSAAARPAGAGGTVNARVDAVIADSGMPLP